MKYIRIIALALSLSTAFLAACGGGGGGQSGTSSNALATASAATPADFSGAWSGTSGSTTLQFLFTQNGNDLVITRTSPSQAAGTTYTGVITGDSAVVTTYAGSTPMGTTTWTKLNSMTITAVVNSCVPAPGYTCGAISGETVTFTKVVAVSFPLDAAYTKAVTNGVSLSGTAVDGADTWTMTMSLTPASDEAFEGVVRKKALQSLTIKKNGTVLAASTIQSYFSVNPFATQGARYSDGTYAVQTSTTGSFASAAKVGDSGSLGIMTLYTNASKTSVQATTEATWTLEADTATTAFGCGNSIVRNSAGVQTGTAAGCYKIDTQGNTLGMRYTLAVAGKTLTFK